MAYCGALAPKTDKSKQTTLDLCLCYAGAVIPCYASMVGQCNLNIQSSIFVVCAELGTDACR